MFPAVVAWGLALVFASAALEKGISHGIRDRFRQALGEFLPQAAGAAAAPLAWVFIGLEGAVLPLLFLLPMAGLNLLVGLAAAVTGYALVQWRQGRLEDCPCGGIWAASGRNLLFRNLLLLAASLYTRTAAPIPIPPVGLLYALGSLAGLLLMAGVVEGIRIQMRTR